MSLTRLFKSEIWAFWALSPSLMAVAIALSSSILAFAAAYFSEAAWDLSSSD